jgi:hypothetical protein
VLSYKVEVVTAAEAYELTTQGSATDFARLIKACESFGPYCLIGGLAAKSGQVLRNSRHNSSLQDVTQGKLWWAYSDPQRRLSKRKKDELDLIRLAEAHPELKALYLSDLRDQIDRG